MTLFLIAVTIGTVVGIVPANAQLPPNDAGMSSVAGATTTVTYNAFIPQNRLDAPTILGKALCTYGTGYQFGGDGHSAFDWTSSRYRVALNAVINWNAQRITSYTSVQTTHVYKKSTGQLVAQRTASSSATYARALGWGTRAGSKYVDIRMVVQSTNPFCNSTVKGAINAAFTIRLYMNGWWEFHSGGFRAMPNTYVYIYNRGRVSDVVKARYESVYCVMGPFACDLVALTGRYGDFS